MSSQGRHPIDDDFGVQQALQLQQPLALQGAQVQFRGPGQQLHPIQMMQQQMLMAMMNQQQMQQQMFVAGGRGRGRATQAAHFLEGALSIHAGIRLQSDSGMSSLPQGGCQQVNSGTVVPIAGSMYGWLQEHGS